MRLMTMVTALAVVIAGAAPAGAQVPPDAPSEPSDSATVPEGDAPLRAPSEERDTPGDTAAAEEQPQESGAEGAGGPGAAEGTSSSGESPEPRPERPPNETEPTSPAPETEASPSAPTSRQADAEARATVDTEAAEAIDYSLDEYDFDADEICPFCEITPEWPEGRRGLHWHSHWHPVGVLEYILVPAIFGTTVAVGAFTDGPTEPRWSSPILFDDAVRDALQVSSDDGQRRTSVASDILLYGSIAYPMVIDNILVAWIGRQSPRVAWQMFVINAQAYSMTLALTGGTKRLAARERPWGEDCPGGRHDCSAEGRYLSFFSGHASMTGTSAGLTCAHHTQLSLYKNPTMDSLACIAAMVFSASTGVFRMSSDNHWATDVLMGEFVGYLSGYLYPTLMYYREFRFSPETHHEHPVPLEPSGPIWAVLPIVQRDSVQLSAGGIF